MITNYLFDSEDMLHVVLDADLSEVTLYENLSICITENVNKHHGIVNGAQGHIISFDRGIIFLTLSDGSNHFLYPIYEESTKKFYFPLLVNYSLTICKVHGKICLDRNLPSLIAFSRVEYFRNIHLLEIVNRFQLCPIKKRPHDVSISTHSQW